ncbi:hypothetical protein B6D60_06770 [candidate division KSB1 bacterium 4484_87]|nr:MAG: hypothetical protein B6D60_06770 [candidate division KSB1 bacterium 4484_87]
MKKSLLAIVANILFLQVLICSAMPVDSLIFLQKKINGWERQESPQYFTGAALFNHIDGGAELFHEFGFRQLSVLNFQKDSLEVSLEIYEMENPTAALGIYLLKCGKETPITAVHSRNSGNYLQITAVKNRYFLQLNNFSGRQETLDELASLLNPILDSIDETPRIPLLAYLPQENIIPGSIFIFRGTYALEPIFTFGDGDIFQLNGKIFGIGADFDSAGVRFMQMVIPYPDSIHAQNAFQNFINFRDPYLKIIEQHSDFIKFMDFQSKPGSVRLKNENILIKINLPVEQ